MPSAPHRQSGGRNGQHSGLIRQQPATCEPAPILVGFVFAQHHREPTNGPRGSVLNRNLQAIAGQEQLEHPNLGNVVVHRGEALRPQKSADENCRRTRKVI